MGNLSLKKFGLGFYAFILIFEPPITPFGQIYLTGAITIILLAIEGRNGELSYVMKRSNSSEILVGLIFITAYLLITSVIDIFFMDGAGLIANRLRTFNQLFVLTSIQVLGALYILIKAKKYSFSLFDVLSVILIAGAIEGVCVLLAYGFAPVRLFFLRFASDVYLNQWHFERRGYGFSATLLDTFGYGLGILAAVALSVGGKKFPIIAYIAMLVFCAFVNTRTGLVFIVAAAVFVYLVRGRGVIRRAVGAILLASLYLLFMRYSGAVIDLGLHSQSVTVRWIASAYQDFWNLIHGTETLQDMQFVDELAPLPSNVFSCLFGTGHTIYDTRLALGFRTDIGYINLLWAYGIVGTLLYYGFMIYMGRVALKASSDSRCKSIVVYILIAFFIIQLKGNILGASPGICITYISLLAVIYFGNDKQASNPQARAIYMLRPHVGTRLHPEMGRF